jgi:hypothetical protein
MYIREIKLENIRSIGKCSLHFPPYHEPGWHVLIGDNGTGKTSILRSIALCLIGPDQILRLDPYWDGWVRRESQEANLEIQIVKHGGDRRSERGAVRGGLENDPPLKAMLQFTIGDDPNHFELLNKSPKGKYAPEKYFWGVGGGWFSCGFGTFRRFSGGNAALEHHYLRNPRVGAFLTLFRDDSALSESIVWLKDIHTRRLQAGPTSEWQKILVSVMQLVNSPNLLPIGYEMMEVNADGAFFSTPDGNKIHLYQLSEGLKSVLGLAFELIRQLSSHQWIFNQTSNDSEAGVMVVNAYGVVLIDEIDSHLHPEWQTRIGQWFVKHFPKIQFIVTTHSPLICRAAENSIIWSLERTEGGVAVSEVTGETKNRLLYGNILDAVDTGLFGESADRSEIAVMMLEEMARLETRELFGKMSDQDKIRLVELKSKHLL